VEEHTAKASPRSSRSAVTQDKSTTVASRVGRGEGEGHVQYYGSQLTLPHRNPARMEEQVWEARAGEPGGTDRFWGKEDGCERIRQVLMAKDVFHILNFKQERAAKRRSPRAPSSPFCYITD